MPKIRLRFTVRRLMLVILIASLLLAGYIAFQDRLRRQAIVNQLHAEILMNDLARAQAGAMAEAARRRGDSPDVVQDHERSEGYLEQRAQEGCVRGSHDSDGEQAVAVIRMPCPIRSRHGRHRNPARSPRNAPLRSDGVFNLC